MTQCKQDIAVKPRKSSSRVMKFVCVSLLVAIVISGTFSAIDVSAETFNVKYTVYVSNGVYYAKSVSTGSIISSSSTFYTVLQKAISTASYGETVKILAGTYFLTATIRGKSGVSIIGEGSPTIDCTRMSSGASIMLLYGSESTIYTLSSSVSKGANSIVLSSTSGLSAGKILFLKSSAVWKKNNLSQKQGELITVGSISSRTVTLASGQVLADSYSTSSYTKAVLVNPIKDVTIQGIKFQGASGKYLYGVRVLFGVNVKIDGCSFNLIESLAIQLNSCMSSTVQNSNFYKSNRSGLGYGVEIDYASQNILVTYNTGNICRHMVAIGGGSHEGIPRNIVVSYNKSYDSTDAAYDSHRVGEAISFSNNYAKGGYQGIAACMYQGTVSGNTIIQTRDRAITLVNPYCISILVSSNTLNDCNEAINVDAPNVTLKSNIIT